MSAPLPLLTPNRPAVFFDRDGVINLDHGYVHTINRFELMDGAAAALRACRSAGLLVFVVTNQSGVARGYFDIAALDVLHSHMRALLAREGAAIDDLRYCPHHTDGTVEAYRCTCDWRKPLPGMILDLARSWRIDLSRSFLIGDKTSDMAAAAAAGITGHRFAGGNLHAFVQPILDRMDLLAGNDPTDRI